MGKIKPGVDFVFKQNSELAKIGTPEQYSEYLETIFPESKVKDIVYHGSLKEISLPFYNNQHFGSLEAAKSRTNFKKQVYGNMLMKEYLYPVKLNVSSLKRVDDADYAWGEVIEQAKKEKHEGLVYLNKNEKAQYNPFYMDPDENLDSYVVFNPGQIHVLGHQKDIEGFKKYVKNNLEQSSSKNSLEKKLILGSFLAFFISGLFFSSPNLTGNIIGFSEGKSNGVGIFLILFGIFGFFVYALFRKDKL